MVCRVCGATNEPGRKFCGHCGTRLALTCPTCGTSNPGDARFCGECGQALGPADASSAPARAGSGGGGTLPGRVASPSGSVAAPITERRLVSVLFADLVGFTGVSEGRDPETVREAENSLKRVKFIRRTVHISRLGAEFWQACDPWAR